MAKKITASMIMTYGLWALLGASVPLGYYYYMDGGLRRSVASPIESKDVQLIPLTTTDQPIIQNMCRYFIYDMSEYLGDKDGWRFPEKGTYECRDWSEYFTPEHKPYLIRYRGEIAGFALVKVKGFHPSVDYHMGEFFILRKFKSRGLGRYAAQTLFRHFPGTWEVMQIPGNIAAQKFWRNVIGEFTKGHFTETQENVVNPVPALMFVQRFSTKQEK